MPKKSATARSGAQRHKPRPQKSFELLHPVSQEQESDAEQETEEAVIAQTSTATAIATAPEVQKASAQPSKQSASTRLAARRQAAQRNQQRHTAALITAEHFAYVRKDLMIIAALAIVMFGAIIVLYFTLGAGA